MKKITLNKTWNHISESQVVSYADNATISHIKKHLAREMIYLKKGSENMFFKEVPNQPQAKVELINTEGFSSQETEEIKLFLSTL